MPDTATAAAPRTNEVVAFLTDLRRELRFSDKLDAHVTEPVKFTVRGTDSPKLIPNPAPGTACWAFRGTPGSHLIHFCLSLFKKLREGADWHGYIAAFAHHELMHACITPRDLKATNEILKTNGVPFSEYNLFEDARIEARGRADFGFPMEWLEFEDLVAADNARSYFFNLIQNRGEDDPKLLTKDVADEPWIERVRDYFFAKALRAADFEDMLALLKEWVAEFPPPPSGSNDTKGDLESGMTISVSAELFSALCDAADEQMGVKAAPSDSETGDGIGERHSMNPEPDFTNHPIAKDFDVRTVDCELGNRIADRLRALLSPTSRRERSDHPAKRVSARAFLTGRRDFYRRKVEGTKTRPVAVAYFIDCSGSMNHGGESGVPAIAGGIAIAMGLNNLARRGLVSGHIVLHQGKANKSRCATYAFPLPEEFFARIPADGDCEAIEHALKKCAPLLRKADYVFCNTDGHICDAPVDKVWLAAHGVRPIGLYCGSAEIAAGLKEWFACVIVRPTVLELLEGLIATVDFARTKRGGR